MQIPLGNVTSFCLLKMWLVIGLKLKLVDATRSHDLRLTLVLVLYLKYKSMKFVSAIYFKGLVNHLFLDNSVSEFLSILEVHSQPKPGLLKRGQVPDCKWCQSAFKWPQSWKGATWKAHYWSILLNMLSSNLLLIRLSECC